MDKYDKAIAYLTENPNQIQEAWMAPRVHVAGCLFDFVIPGICLTMIKTFPSEYEDHDFYAGIIADTRIPKSPADITVESLPVFAEWQRKVNAYIR